jgi:hypothetical protein
LLIKDFYKVLRDELNSEEPIAIITANRKGFDTSQEFYLLLKAQIVKIINANLKDIGEETDEFDISSNKQISDALKKLNSFFIENMPEEIPYSGKEKGVLPPEQGIVFIRDEMSLTVSKKYMIEILINAKVVPDHIPIILKSENDTVIGINQQVISFKKEEANSYGLVKKSFLIEALEFSENPIKISAKIENFYCQAFITTIDYDLHYPLDGLEFFPDHIRQKPKKLFSANLFVDKTYYPLGTRIRISSIEPYIIIENDDFLINEEDFDKNGIAVFKIYFSGGELGSKFKIKASVNEISSLLKVEIKAPDKKKDNGTLGLISSIKFHSDYEKKEEQASFSKTDKVLLINRVNPINKAVWSNIELFNDINTIAGKQLNYLFDLCSYHGALQIIEYQLLHGSYNFSKDEFSSYWKKIYQLKTEIFEIIKKN